MKIKVLLWLCLSLSPVLNAQSFSLGVMTGFATYSGDLSPANFGIFLPDAQPAFGAYGCLSVTPWLQTRLSFNSGAIRGADATGKNPGRDLHFRSRIDELLLTAELRIWRLGPREGGNALETFVYGGIGAFRFNPQARYEGQWVDLQPLGTEGQGLAGYAPAYALTQINFPAGLLIQHTWGERITLGVHLGGRKLTTDYLDDVGSALVNAGDLARERGRQTLLLSNPDAEASPINSTYRRGGAFKDWYFIGGIQFGYRIFDLSGTQRGNYRAGDCYRF